MVDLDQAVGGNGGDSNRVLEYVKELKAQDALDFDYFVFNCGLHDLRTLVAQKDYQVSKEQYGKNLQEIIDIITAENIKVYFISTTRSEYLRHNPEGSFVRYAEDVVAYNEMAKEVMEKNQVPIIDLYGFTNSLGLDGDDLFRDHTHFRTEVIKLQAAYIAGNLDRI